MPKKRENYNNEKNNEKKIYIEESWIFFFAEILQKQ